MAIMAPHIQIVKRSSGRSAIAFAAYRAAALLYDQRTGLTHDYSKKSGVTHTEVLAPSHAPSWVYDRQLLWSRVEQAANRKDAQLAREFMLPLPAELSHEARIDLVRRFVKDTFVSKGMIADIAIHLPDRHGDQRNHHAHVTCTMRQIGKEGFGKQAREWNDDFAGLKKLYALRRSGKTAEARAFERELRANRPIFDWREKWAAHINSHLEAAGFAHRVDHRSWIEQGLDREPEIHMGVDATHLERKGEPTRAGDHNRAVRERNGARNQAGVLDHKQAAALDRTRKALAQLRAFDEAHTELNHAGRQISIAYAARGKYEGRRRYAANLTRQLRADFKTLYGESAGKAFGKFRRDISRLGIEKAASKLARFPGRYGALPGLQIGSALYLSPKRKEARALRPRPAELARQAYYMTRKGRQQDAPLRAQLEKRLANLKEQQSQILRHPPEGRLIIQRALYETARGLDNEAWSRLTPQDRFHIVQARQIMKDKIIRAWADDRARQLITNTLGPAPSQDFMLSLLTKPVDLAAISPDLKRAELDKRYADLAARRKKDLEALAAARKAAEAGLEVKHTQIAKGGFTAFLARSTGLDHLFAELHSRRKRAIEQTHAAAKRAADTGHKAELKALQTAYKSLYARLTAREHDASQKRKLAAELKRSLSDARIPSATFEEIKNRRRADRGYAWRRPNGKRKKPRGPEDNGD